MTLTDIANRALEAIGGEGVNNIDDSDAVSRKVKRAIFAVIDDVSTMRKWICLRRKITLARVNNEPIDGEYQFNAPKGLLEIVKASANWRREGDFIFSPNNELHIVCTISIYEPSQWCKNLQGAVIAKLKAELAISVVGGREIVGYAQQLCERDISRYILNDIHAETPQRIQKKSTWYDSFG